MAFNSDGSKGKDAEFKKYEDGTTVSSRIAANKTMGVGLWSKDKSDKAMIDAMSDIQRVGAMGVASEVAKGDAFQRSKYGGNISKFEKDSTEIEKANFDSTYGKADGVRANKKAGVDYAKNAKASEEAKQQSTSAAIKQFDSIKDYVDSQVKKAEESATTDRTKMDLHNKEGWTQKTLDSAADKSKDKKAFYKQVAKAGGGTYNEDTGVFTAAKVNDFSNAMARLQATNMGRDKQFTVNGESFNVDTDIDGNSRVTNTSAQVTSRGNSKNTVNGSSEIFNNDVKKLNNTDPLSFITMKRFGGDMQKAADFARSAEGAKWLMDPRNELSLVTAELGHQIAKKTGMSAEGAAIISGSLAAGGLTLGAINKFTKQPIQFNKKQLSKLEPILDDNDNIKGYEDSKGNKVADKDGFAVDKSGKRVERGAVSRAMRSSWNKIADLRSEVFSSNQPSNSSTNNQNGKNNNSTSNHKTPPNSDKDIITNNSEKSKLRKKGTVSEIIEPDIKGEPKPTFDGPPLSEPGTVGEKGFFQKRIDAFSDAMHGGGNWKTKLGLATSSILLGEASATAGQLMEAADPTSYLMGSSTSKMADLSYAMAHGGVPTTNTLPGTQPLGMPMPTSGNVVPVTPPPQQDTQTMVSQAVGNYENAQMVAQAVSAQNVTSEPTATEATNTFIADTLKDSQQQQFGFARKAQIQANAADTTFRMSHKESMEFKEMTAGLNNTDGLNIDFEKWNN